MASTQYSFERREEKYFLTPVQYEALLTPLRQHMHADEHEQYTICSLYCDTPDWQLIRTSLEKPYYKEKLRVRSYGTPTPDGRVFVELKKKVGGIVYKRRIALPAARADAFLRGEVSVPGRLPARSAGSSGCTARSRVCSSPMTGRPLPGSRSRVCA